MTYADVIRSAAPASWIRFNEISGVAFGDQVLGAYCVPYSGFGLESGYTGIASDGGSASASAGGLWQQIQQKYVSGTPPVDLPLSGEVWLFPSSTASNTTTYTIVQWGFSNGFGFMSLSPTGQYSMGSGAVGGCSLGPSSATPFAPGSGWTYIAWTWSTTTFTVYRNGSLESTFSGGVNTCSASGNHSYGIGMAVNPANAVQEPAFFIAEHATYHRVLSGSEIAAHHAAADLLAAPRKRQGIASVCT